MAEFATQGIAGARTDAIAEAAGVNKALLYYYFEDKEGLYRACLETVFAGLMERVRPVFAAPGNSLEKMVKYATTHFDYIAEAPYKSRLVQGELMRASVGKSPHMQYLGDKYFRKMMESLLAVLTDGIRRGEIRAIDPTNAITSVIGLVVFYFVSTPVARIVGRQDPLIPDSLHQRRAALIDHVSAILRPDTTTPARGKTL